MWQGDETGIVAITAHMSKAELITLLAVQKNADGTYAYSANRIRDFVGGTTSAVMEQIKAVRPDAKPAPQAPQPSRGKSLRRPARGW